MGQIWSCRGQKKLLFFFLLQLAYPNGKLLYTIYNKPRIESYVYSFELLLHYRGM